MATGWRCRNDGSGTGPEHPGRGRLRCAFRSATLPSRSIRFRLTLWYAAAARTSLDLQALVHEVCAGLHSLAETRQVRIEASSIEAERGRSPALVAGNRPALRRLFVILLDNAVKYPPAGAEVRLRRIQEDGRVSVSIEDSGAGISTTDLPHIFERFYRATEGLNTESREGHGLGLALADPIARAHGATIEVRSSEGASSEFRVSFAAPASANLQIAAIL